MQLSNKLKLVVILLVINCFDGHAQNFSLNPKSGSTTGSVQYIHDRLNPPPDYPIEGTPYFTDAYSKSHVYSQSGNFSDIEMRYNVFNDWMEFKRRDSVYIIDPDLMIKKIVLGTQTFVVDNYEFKGKTVPSYFLRLDSGRVTLMTKMTVLFKDRQQGKAITGDVPAKYQRQPDVHYFKLGSGPLIKVRSIKKMIDQLPDGKQEMEAFARNEKISTNNAEELTRFIQYYNSLK